MKKITFIFTFICVLFIMTGCTSKYKLDKHETVGYTSLRLAIATSASSGDGEISSEYLDRVKSAVKNFNDKSEWFDDYSGNFYGITKDTSDNQVDFICDEDYCAKITVKNDNTGYYIIDYSFETNDEKGYRIYIK